MIAKTLGTALEILGQRITNGLTKGLEKALDKLVSGVNDLSSNILGALSKVGDFAKQLSSPASESVKAAGHLRNHPQSQIGSSPIGRSLGFLGNTLNAATGLQNTLGVFSREHSRGSALYPQTLSTAAQSVLQSTGAFSAGSLAASGTASLAPAALATLGLEGSLIGGAAISAAPVIAGVAAGIIGGYLIGKGIDWLKKGLLDLGLKSLFLDRPQKRSGGKKPFFLRRPCALASSLGDYQWSIFGSPRCTRAPGRRSPFARKPLKAVVHFV